MRRRPATATSAAATTAQRSRLSGGRNSSRSRRWIWRANSSPRATISGTAACSCSRRAATWRSSRAFAPDILEARRGGLRRRPRRIWISCASTRRRSRNAAATRSTMRSWRRPAMPWCCRSMRAGATSAPGPRCSMRCRRTRKAMCCRATCWCTTRTTATCTRPAVWSPPSAWTITSSSRPRMRCWSRPRSACRT